MTPDLTWDLGTENLINYVSVRDVQGKKGRPTEKAEFQILQQ